ncbi:heme-binding protein [Beijerinckia sp. L45]|uniref:GlcG/HbpS family heme-binding protein n=1 Tax=Beijerinckia sp. L45 TaxID=1641855 RepID=UPI001AEDB0A0|nr:heme-binding protein [Beijerinckia sp. L45]
MRIAPIATLLSLLLVSSASAQLGTKKVLTLAAARQIIAAAEAKANEEHLRGVIAVVDDGGWIIMMERMDDPAMTASVELAPAKARSAALFKKPTQALEGMVNKGRTAAVTAGFTMMQGGLPITVDGQVIGGIGVSFDTPDHDSIIAEAGLAALNH